MKTAELKGATLDYWVARAEGLEEPMIDGMYEKVCTYVHHYEPGDDGWWTEYEPSTNWAQGGPLIEKYAITPYPSPFGGWDGYNRPDIHESRSETPLQAVCRAVVRTAFGDEVPE